MLPDATRAYVDWLISYPQMIEQHPESARILLAEQLAAQLQRADRTGAGCIL